MSSSKSLLDLSPKVFRDLCDNLETSAVRGWQDLLAHVTVVKYTPLQMHRFAKMPSPAEEVLIDLSKVGVGVDDLYHAFAGMEHRACMEVLLRTQCVSAEVVEEERIRMEQRSGSKAGAAPPSNTSDRLDFHPIHGPIPSDPPPLSEPSPSNPTPTNRMMTSSTSSGSTSSSMLRSGWSGTETASSQNGTRTSSLQSGTGTGPSQSYYSGSWTGTGTTSSSQIGTGTGTGTGASNPPYSNGSSQISQGRFIPQLPPSMMSSGATSSYATSVPSSAHSHDPYQSSQPPSHATSYRRLEPSSSTDSYTTLLPASHQQQQQQQQLPNQQYWDTPTGSRDAMATPSSLYSTSLSSYMASSVTTPTDPPPPGSGGLVPMATLPNILCYPYEELSKATGGFTQNIVGIGSFGTVYRAMVRGNGPYAVKKLHNETEMGEVGFYEPFHQESFLQELQLLTKYNHTNILSLVAYSSDGTRPCLVYEYMKNGSLADCLLGKRNIELPWKRRMTIANQIADAIHFLHSANTPNVVVHGDIKSANILLDGNLVAKLSDFGLARETQRKTQRTTTSTSSALLKGTIPYMAPEFIRNGKLTAKTDVYSFGVVLLELFTGQAPGQNDGDSVGRRGVLTERLSPYIANSDRFTREIVALGDYRAGWPEDVGSSLFTIATVCLTPKHTKRPEMDQVRDQLRE